MTRRSGLTVLDVACVAAAPYEVLVKKMTSGRRKYAMKAVSPVRYRVRRGWRPFPFTHRLPICFWDAPTSSSGVDGPMGYGVGGQ